MRNYTIDRALSALPARLVNGGPELRISRLPVREQAKYWVSRLLVAANCNQSDLIGQAIHGRVRISVTGESRQDLEELFQHIHAVIIELFVASHEITFTPYIMDSTKRISPISESDITMVLKPR